MILELHSLVVQRNGVWMHGKYDYSRQTPFAALIDAVNSFYDFLLLSNESTRSLYVSQIRAAIGEQGKLLTDIVPNLTLLIGEQKPVPDSLGPPAKNRLIYVFVNFMKAICSVDFPVILILEDLQLLDKDSLDLLSAMIADKNLKNMMFIGTFRTNEVHQNHPVQHLMEFVKNLNIKATNIELNNICCESVNDLISDTLKIPPMKSYQLSVPIYKTTNGNPFFICQLLKSFVTQQIIFYCNQIYQTMYMTNKITRTQNP